MRAIKLLCGAAALVAFLAPGAHADEWNKLTYLTFSGPVQIPGATLPAGTYAFEIANPDTTRHVIRVSEKDSGKHIGLFMTIPNNRMDPPNDNLVMFAERPAGAPQAIQVWSCRAIASVKSSCIRRIRRSRSRRRITSGSWRPTLPATRATQKRAACRQ